MSTLLPACLVILLVDDNLAERRLFRYAVSDYDKDVLLYGFATGDALIEWLQHPSHLSHGAVIVLDINMPGQNGFEVLSHLKQMAGLSHIPVIMFSSSDHQHDVEQAYRQGADAYIQKPDCYDALARCIHAIDDVCSIGVRAPLQPYEGRLALSETRIKSAVI